MRIVSDFVWLTPCCVAEARDSVQHRAVPINAYRLCMGGGMTGDRSVLTEGEGGIPDGGACEVAPERMLVWESIGAWRVGPHLSPLALQAGGTQ